MDDNAAIVLFSGGQDSTTCLAWALERFERVETVGFNYGQRHKVELEVRAPIIEALASDFPKWAPRIGEDHVLDLSILGKVSETSLTRDVEITMQANGLPSTFVPGRNLLFLTFAATIAYRRGIKHIVTGVCETDYSGYPDCRDDTIKAMQLALNLGMERRFVLHTPLMWIDKAETWAMADRLGGTKLSHIVSDLTHTCYNGDRTALGAWGRGCGTCPACKIRMAGYDAFLQSADRS